MTPTVQVIQPTGLFVAPQTTQFEQEIHQAITTGAEIILMDCQDVTFMDSSGLGALILGLKAVRSAHRKLVLCSINSQVEQLFTLTDTHRIFELYADRAEFERTLKALGPSAETA